MVTLIVRVIVVFFLIGFVYFLIRNFMKPLRLNKKNMCQKCDGKGYWIGTRGKEGCDACRGTGKLIP